MITDYTELQAAVKNWLLRNDLTERIPEFIQIAEVQLRDDDRVELIETNDLTVSGDDHALPVDYRSIKSLYHDGPEFFGPIETVRPDELGRRKADLGTTGTPRYVAVIDKTGAPVLRFAPVPDATFNIRLTYEAEIDPLSATNLTNTFLDRRPDLYLYKSLLASAPFLMEDERIVVWQTLLDEQLEIMARNKKNREFGGRISMRPRSSIGSEVGRR